MRRAWLWLVCLVKGHRAAWSASPDPYPCERCGEMLEPPEWFKRH